MKILKLRKVDGGWKLEGSGKGITTISNGKFMLDFNGFGVVVGAFRNNGVNPYGEEEYLEIRVSKVPASVLKSGQEFAERYIKGK